MYLTNDRIGEACGFLLLNDFNAFIYCCKKCPCEYLTGSELEQHISFYHQDEKEHIDGIFVNDGVLDATLSVPIESESVEPDSSDKTNGLIDRENESDIENGSKEENGQEIQKPNAHESSVEPNESDGDKTEVKKPHRRKTITGVFYCDMCPGVTFSTLNIVRQHMRRHRANKVSKKCEICGKKPRDFEKHIQMAHLHERPYKCDFCESSFKSNINRVIHMRKHTGERPFLCSSCGKCFISQDTRNKHNMRMHSDTLPHPCLECKRSFISPSQLQEHTYSFHSDARPYACETCGNCYSTRKYLRKHRQSHGEKIHLCRYCEKKFKTTETRRWHERTVHKAL